MAFTQLTGTKRGTLSDAHSANTSTIDLWAIFRALRDARCAYGLKPGHIQTLQALMSFLRPGQGETVFASNLEICRRTGGVDERTLRRHIDRFVDLGFIVRHDSPNRKRYRVRSSSGESLSFGLSLSPLLARSEEFVAKAEALENTRRDMRFLRKQLLAILAQIHNLAPDMALLKGVHNALRRKLTECEYHALIGEATAALDDLSTAVDMAIPMNLSANDGQIVRHQSKSEKEDKDLEHALPLQTPNIALLTAVCSEAAAFAHEPMRNWGEVERHARKLAPMMGIRPETFEAASQKAGSEKAATAIFVSLQLGARIRNLAAYFHSITLGQRASSFDPSHILERLARSPLRTA